MSGAGVVTVWPCRTKPLVLVYRRSLEDFGDADYRTLEFCNTIEWASLIGKWKARTQMGTETAEMYLWVFQMGTRTLLEIRLDFLFCQDSLAKTLFTFCPCLRTLCEAEFNGDRLLKW